MREAEDALFSISSDTPRDEWVKTLMAAQAAGISKDTCRDWSATADSFSNLDFESTWRSLKPGAITERTLFARAKESGWRSGRPVQRPAPVERPVVAEVPRTFDYAKKVWAAGNDDDVHVSKQDYCKRKRITHAFGARRGSVSGRLIGQAADCVLVPNRDWEGRLVGVECINADGVKQTYGRKGMLILGHPEAAPVIHVCEGWASAWAISQLFPDQFACLVAFGKGKMNTLSSEAGERYSGTVLVHADSLDNRDVWDLWVAGEGEQYAARARRAVSV